MAKYNDRFVSLLATLADMQNQVLREAGITLANYSGEGPLRDLKIKCDRVVGEARLLQMNAERIIAEGNPGQVAEPVIAPAQQRATHVVDLPHEVSVEVAEAYVKEAMKSAGKREKAVKPPIKVTESPAAVIKMPVYEIDANGDRIIKEPPPPSNIEGLVRLEELAADDSSNGVSMPKQKRNTLPQ